MFDNILYGGVAFPSSPEYFLKRPRLNNLLDNAVKKPFTTIIAGAGYGKSQSVFAFLESTDKKFIWLQLSELDNLTMRFWERIVYGFKQYSSNLADNLLALGYPETDAAFDKFLHLIAATILDLKSLIIVFDDFYLISNKIICAFLEKLIIAKIRNLSIVLISRTKPDLNIAGMLSKGLAGSIIEDDLRFTQDEISMYYKMQHLNLNEKVVSDIYVNTEGWILAAYLIGLSLKKGHADKYSLTLAKVNIFELIDEEIFSLASEKLRQFLIKIAVLDVVPKSLLMILAEGEEFVLAEMAKINLLMRYDSLTDSYRVHHLFRDFLLERNTLTKEELEKIYRVTAKWYEENAQISEAIKYYHKCGDYDKVFDIVLAINKIATQETGEFYINLIESAPIEIIQKRPILKVVKCFYLLNNNKIDIAYNELTILKNDYEALPPTQENLLILGEVCIGLALISTIRQNYEFEELFIKANLCLPNGSSIVDYRMNIADGINITGIKNSLKGELKKYYDTMFRIMPIASKVMNGCCFGAEYLNAADSHFMTGNIKEAEENAFKAIFYAREKLQYGIEFMANFILIRIYVLRGDYNKAMSLLGQMKDQTNILQIADSIYQYDIIEGWFFTKIFETDRIAEWIRKEEETKKLLPPVTVGREYLVRSDSLLAEGRYSELLAYMDLTDNIYAERGILYALIQNRITRAIVYHYMGNEEASCEALTKAYELSSPNDLIIQYIEYGNQMRTVIAAVKRGKNSKIPEDWLDKIYTKSSSYAKQVASVIKAYKLDNNKAKDYVIVLSKREKEVLTYLSVGLTRTEIANSLNLSINTVKSIIINIYNKLGAANNADAVRTAAEMGLI